MPTGLPTSAPLIHRLPVASQKAFIWEHMPPYLRGTQGGRKGGVFHTGRRSRPRGSASGRTCRRSWAALQSVDRSGVRLTRATIAVIDHGAHLINKGFGVLTC